MNRLLIAAVMFAGLSLQCAQAADPDNGGRLVAEHCVRCHGEEIYTRTDRIVSSHDGLRAQVRRCVQMLGLMWFDEDVDDVVAHLNRNYYLF